MKGIYNYVISPLGERYNNKKEIDGKEVILNTEIFNHQYVNRNATVISCPMLSDTPVKPGDEVVVHHNVFRRWYNVKGIEKNSKAWFSENKYIVSEDQIFLYKSNKEWKACDGYCFVQPIKQRNKMGVEQEEQCVGIVKYTDGVFQKKELVGFTPFSTYEFVVEGVRLYRVMNKFITIKYEYQGDEEEYNPSWAQSG